VSAAAGFPSCYPALVITGGRLGDIVGRRRVFIAGVLGFTLASLWCGLSGSAAMLIFARAAQGGAAAMMVPQVLASIHTLFPDGARARAFTIFAVAIGLGAAVGFMLGGWLVTLNLAGLGWRSIFCVNVPFGVGIALAAGWLMPAMPRNADIQLDLRGAVVLFVGLLGLIVLLMFGREHWPWWMWLAMAAGLAVLFGFVRMQRAVERRAGTPLMGWHCSGPRVRGRHGANTPFFLGNLSFPFRATYCRMALASRRSMGRRQCRWPSPSPAHACRPAGRGLHRAATGLAALRCWSAR
jgi:MFS family permease